ncbi:hypothetical protein EMCRGX_G015476 [Ephydatia muelleri]
MMKALAIVAAFSFLWWEASGSCPFFGRTSPPLGTYLCPRDTVNYTCTISDASQSASVVTTWAGSVFKQCSPSQILLAQRGLGGATDPTSSGACGNLSAMTTDITGPCYTSVLTISSPRYVNGSTVLCGSAVVVGNDTLNVLMACPPSPPTITPVSCTSSSLTISWTKPSECGSPISQYTLTTNPPSLNCNPSCTQSPDLTQATLTVQPSRSTTVSLRADNCGGTQAGQTSSASYIIQASGLVQDFRGIPVFSSQGIVRIDFSWTPMSLQLAPGGLQCGPLPNYTISNGTQSVPVLCSSSPCQYSLVFQSLLATSSYNVSLSGPSLSSVSRQIATTNNVLNVSASSAVSKTSVVNCTFLSGLAGTSGCVVSFGTSPDNLPYTLISSQSGGSGQSVSVPLVINGSPLAPNSIYYFAATTTNNASLVTVISSFQTANYSVDCTPLALGGQPASITKCSGQSTLLVANGYICYDPSLGQGSVASLYCNYGYQVIGTSSRSCQWTGDWSGTSFMCGILQPQPAPSGSGAVGAVVGGVLGGVILIAIILIAGLLLWKFGPGRLWNTDAEPIIHVKVHRKDKHIESDYVAGTLERGSGSDLSGQKRSPRMSPRSRGLSATPTHALPPSQELDPTSGQQLAPSLSLTSQSIPPGKRSTIALQPKRASKVIQSTNSLTFVDITKEGPGLDEAIGQNETQS